MNRTILDGESVLQGIVSGIFNPIYGVVAAGAFVYFLYGVFEFLMNQENEEKNQSG